MAVIPPRPWPPPTGGRPQCCQSNPPHANFCAKCGRRLRAGAERSPDSPTTFGPNSPFTTQQQSFLGKYYFDEAAQAWVRRSPILHIKAEDQVVRDGDLLREIICCTDSSCPICAGTGNPPESADLPTIDIPSIILTILIMTGVSLAVVGLALLTMRYGL